MSGASRAATRRNRRLSLRSAMYKYNRVLIALNLLSDQDETTLRYAGMLGRLGMPNAVYVAHVAETLDIPDSVREAYPEALRPLDETIEEQLRYCVGAHFGERPANTDVHYLVGEGPTAETLLRWTKLKDIDLVIVGSRRRGRARAPRRSGRPRPRGSSRRPCAAPPA